MRITVACVVILLFAYSIAFASPDIFFDDDSYDFGDVNQGDLLEHTFTFKNIGDQTLVIEKVTAS